MLLILTPHRHCTELAWLKPKFRCAQLVRLVFDIQCEDVPSTWFISWKIYYPATKQLVGFLAYQIISILNILFFCMASVKMYTQKRLCFIFLEQYILNVMAKHSTVCTIFNHLKLDIILLFPFSCSFINTKDKAIFLISYFYFYLKILFL